MEQPPKSWREETHRVWVTLWTGNAYRLKDLGRGDAKALSMLLMDAIDQTYERFLRKAVRSANSPSEKLN
jgi:hypothetical protein